MPRIEREIMTGWKFALRDTEPTDNEYREIVMPHDWVISAPFNKDMKQGEAQGFRDRWGIGWYKKHLLLNEKKSGYKYYLDFGGIYENSTVWMNGHEVGGHKYGYSSFRLDVTSYVLEGENIIQIKVDNTASPADRWYSGCGIYRTVKWIEVETKHLDEREVIVQTKISGKDAVVYVVSGINEKVRGRLRQQGIIDEAVAEAFTNKKGEILLQVSNVKLWSAEEPYLYDLELTLLDEGRECDTIHINIGIREIAVISGKGLFVNGKMVKLKGVCLHQEVGCRGIAARKEIWQERLKDLKEMGCNSIRTAHHTHSVEFMDLCDEMGFYVYEECFDKWTSGLYGRYFDTEWQKDVDAMVKRDRNRPSVIIWGVGNEVENQGQDSMLHILKMLYNYIKSMDVSRPITYAMNPHFKSESHVDITKIKDTQKFVDDTEISDNAERVRRICRIGAIVDIISCNYQEQWYPMIHKAMPDKLILGSEVYQFFKGNSDQMQNFTNENPSLVMEQSDYCIGSMIWTGFDYLGESMGYPAKGWSGAMIRTNRSRRPSYYIFQSYWSEKPMVHFSVMDYSLHDEGAKEHWDTPVYADHWHFPQFQRTVLPYMISSNCDEVALFLNDKRFYIPKPSEFFNRVITGFLPYQKGTVKVIGYQNGEEVCKHIMVTPGPAIKLEFEVPYQKISAQEGYEILLTVRAKDEDGNPYFRESSLVRFSIEGNAEILAVDNGDLMGSESYNEEFIHMYHGCASVLVRLKGDLGRVVVMAKAEGLYEGKVIINVE